MSHTQELAQNRRSIRKYTADPISRDRIEAILQVAGRAPSAWNLQPWRVVAVSDPAVKSELQQAAFNQPQVGGAPVVLVVYSDMAATLAGLDDVLPNSMAAEARDKLASRIRKNFETHTSTETEAWGRAQAGIFLGYLLLLIEAFGYSSSPMLGCSPKDVKALFDLPEHVEVAALVAIGKAAEIGTLSKRRELDSILRWS
jgi:nitroreductase